MSELHLPWLELTVLCPILGALFVFRVSDPDKARLRTAIFCGLTLFCTIAAWKDFGTLHSFEAHDRWDFATYWFGPDVLVIDELSAPLIPLAALLYLLTVLATLRTQVRRFMFAGALVSEAILLATLSCRAPWAIIGLLAASIVPPWLEMQLRGRCTRVFLLHMGLFISMLIAGWSLMPASAKLDVSPETRTAAPIAAILLLSGAVLLRAGIVPVHCWMTDLFEKATFGTALLFVTPITGAYAAIRLVMPIAPDWALRSIALISLTTAVYAACMALVQRETRRFFCYLFLSNSALVLVGMETVTPGGLTGALCVWLSVGMALAGFGLTLRSLEARMGRMSLTQYHGLHDEMPTHAAFFLLTGLASIGFPGTIGFVGSELLIEGAVAVYPYLGTTVVFVAALNGIAVIKAYFRLFTGTRYSTPVCLNIRRPERFAVLTLTVLIVGGGLYPQPGVASRYHAAMALVQLRGKALREPATTSSPAHAEATGSTGPFELGKPVETAAPLPSHATAESILSRPTSQSRLPARDIR